MPYNTKLEERIDGLTARWKDFDKKRMFGGVCYLARGNMCFGIWKDALIVRMDRERSEKSLGMKNVRPFDITGRAMAGWILVDPAGWKSAAGLAKWMKIGRAFAATLPEKKGKARKRKKTLRAYRG